MFTAKDNLDEFRRDVTEFNRAVSDGLRRGVEQACREGAAEARATHRFQNRSHALEDSIDGHLVASTPGAALGVIEATAKHASFVEGGTRPHDIRAKGKTLAFEAGGGTVFAKAVHHPGTAPDGFMGRAYQKA